MAVRFFLPWLVAFAVASVASGVACRAEPATHGHGGAPFADAPIIGNPELVRMRGGFAAAFGLEIEFSVLARTTVDGQTVLSTVMSFNGAGGLPTAPVAGAGGASPSNIDVSALADQPGGGFHVGEGIVVGFAQVEPGQAFNLIASVGMNRRIEQELSLIFSVKGFSRFQQDARTAAVATRLTDLLAPP